MAPRRTRRDISTGEVFVEWVVVTVISRRYCLCRCSCGTERRVSSYHLLDGFSSCCKSCARKVYDYGTVTEHPPRLRLVVNAAINRCMDENHPRYDDWGGRGIRVHQAWLDSRAAFVEYLMGLGGWNEKGLLLDRIDNDGDYEPGNLRFTDPTTSNRDQRLRKDSIIRALAHKFDCPGGRRLTSKLS